MIATRRTNLSHRTPAGRALAGVGHPATMPAVLFLGGLLACVLALLWLALGLNHAQDDLDVQRAQVMHQQEQLQKALTTIGQANTKLENAGQSPVPVPTSVVSAASAPPTPAAGSNGSDGSDGSDGLPGPQGPAGPSGSNGSPGVAGPSGIAGQPGSPGVAGPSGVAGKPGDAATAPPAGAAGPAGPAGRDGQNGKDGTNGSNGQDGVAGAPGQPPAGWTFTDLAGTTYTCTRASAFDPAAPSYTCAQDTPQSPPPVPQDPAPGGEATTAP